MNRQTATFRAGKTYLIIRIFALRLQTVVDLLGSLKSDIPAGERLPTTS